MPELPEVETIVRGIRPVLLGAEIRRVDILHRDVLRQEPDEFRTRLVGRRIRGIERRGKNTVIQLEGERKLVINLGMTGRLRVDPPTSGERAPTHPALLFRLRRDGGGTGVLVYDDIRRFGALEALTDREWRRRARNLGPEPLDSGLTGSRFGELLARSRSPLRSWLLDQRRLAGVGNIYANEALFRARLHPLRAANSLTPREASVLLRSLRGVLSEAVEARGTTFRDYQDATGGRGAFSLRLEVYRREGELCSRCGAPIERLVFGNRSAFLCPRCQAPAEGGKG